MENKIDWDEEEILLAIELYIRSGKKPPTAERSEVIDLSNFLRHRSKKIGRAFGEKHRNPNGVESKLWNIAYIDTDGRVGRAHGSVTDKFVCEKYLGKEDVIFRDAKIIKEKYEE